MKLGMRVGAGILVLAGLLATSAARGQTLAHKGWSGSGITVDPWWRGAVFYRIDPISFQDSNGDGFGDLHGIMDRLPYLQALQVDAVVLSPFRLEETPGKPVDPILGTVEDFDGLIAEASRRRMRVIVDLPFDGARPLEEALRQARFWLGRGVAGLRLIRKDSEPEMTSYARRERVRALRRIAGGYGGERVLIDDTGWNAGAPFRSAASASPGANSGQRAAHPGGGDDAVQMKVSRGLTALTRLDAKQLREQLLALATEAGRPARVACSDDDEHPRSFDRMGDDSAVAKALAAVLLAGPALPLLEFGQELGMETTPAPVSGETASPAGDPTPMQWGGDPGFTGGVPWMKMGRNAATANVAAEDADPGSLLNWYRALVTLHHGNAALRGGSFAPVTSANPELVAWVRRARSGAGTTPPVLVIVNASARAQVTSVASFAANLRKTGVAGQRVRALLASANAPGSDVAAIGFSSAIALPPFGVWVGEVRSQAGLEDVVLPPRSRRKP